MSGSFFMIFMSKKLRTWVRLFLASAALGILLLVGGACNSPAAEEGVSVEVTATPKSESQVVATDKPTSDDETSSLSQAEVESAPTTVASPDERTADNQVDDAFIANSLLPDANHIEGDPDAPVTIVEFSDFKCPYCAQFSTGTLHWLREYYVKTGKVRFAFKHIATLGPESLRAAEASECAAEQNQFWAYHDQIFIDQAAKASELNDEALIELAADIGLETDAFSECLTSGRYTKQVKLQTEEAQRLGVQATPGFIINNSFTMGAQPYEAFARIINGELDKLGWKAPAGQAATVADQIKGLIVYPPASPPAEVLNGKWQNCGIYDEAVSIDNVLGSLSHGAVWIAYHTDLPADQIEVLREVVGRALAQRDEPMVILSPGPYTDRKIVISAWQVQLTLEDASDPRLEQFLEIFQVGPFTPEPGEPCSGGVGQPLS